MRISWNAIYPPKFLKNEANQSKPPLSETMCHSVTLNDGVIINMVYTHIRRSNRVNPRIILAFFAALYPICTKRRSPFYSDEIYGR